MGRGRQILLLVPRRLAARSAAEYMARERGEEAGATIGYATRLDSRVGKSTRVIAMTHGVYLSRLQADPELAGVARCCSTKCMSAASTATWRWR